MPEQNANTPTLQVDDLRKNFGALEVLKGISLSAYEHNVISILGSSGSGKSTFLRCINLLETPTSGDVHFKGEHIEMRERANGERVPRDRKQVDRIRSRSTRATSFLLSRTSPPDFSTCA